MSTHSDDWWKNLVYSERNIARNCFTVRYWGIRIGLIAVILTAVGMAGCPPYEAWEKGISGQAALNYAEKQRKILIEQAKAEEEAAQHRANAIGIVGQAAKDFPEYRKQEFIGAFGEALNNDSIDKIIFVPTEANIPVTEAGRSVD
jgi:hypothetical protein